MSPTRFSKIAAEPVLACPGFESIHPNDVTGPSPHHAVASASTTLTKVTERMFEGIPTTPTIPVLSNAPPVRIPSIQLNGFKRIMTSPIVVNSTSEISMFGPPPTIVMRAEEIRSNDTNPSEAITSTGGMDYPRGASPWVIFGFIVLAILSVAMILSTQRAWFKVKLMAHRAVQARKEEDAEELSRMRIAGLNHVRVELKDLGEVMRPERAV